MDEELPKNFLKEVIIRFDFAIPIENIEHKLPKELSLDIRKAFPICEIAQIAEGKIDIRVDTDGPDVGTTKDRYTQWRYFGDEKRKLIELDKKHFAVIFYHYQTFTEFQQTYRDILDIIYKNFGEPQFERVGLRYINEIQLEEKDPLNWTKYLEKSLLSIFKIYPDKSRLSRAFHVLCINLDNIKITFRYGMHNPDFPAPIKQKIFILDYDAYHEGIIEAIEIDKYVDSFRSEIKTLFKGNIKSALKNKMR